MINFLLNDIEKLIKELEEGHAADPYDDGENGYYDACQEIADKLRTLYDKYKPRDPLCTCGCGYEWCDDYCPIHGKKGKKSNGTTDSPDFV
jgi:hypothetical protein